MVFISNLGGMAGGGVMIPISALFFYFDPKNSISISNATICIGSIIRIIICYKLKHPLKPWASVIDADYAAILVPFAMAGSYIGVTIYAILPRVILMTFITLVLLYVQIVSAIKYVK